jgi:hypothetical protein
MQFRNPEARVSRTELSAAIGSIALYSRGNSMLLLVKVQKSGAWHDQRNRMGNAAHCHSYF